MILSHASKVGFIDKFPLGRVRVGKLPEIPFYMYFDLHVTRRACTGKSDTALAIEQRHKTGCRFRPIGSARKSVQTRR